MVDYEVVLENTLKKFPIRPEDINMEELSFGKCEVEMRVRNLIRFFRERKDGNWAAFLKVELERFSRETRGEVEKDVFFGLLGKWFDDAPILGGVRNAPPYIIEISKGVYAVTDLFIKRCAWGRKTDAREKKVKVEVNITGDQGLIMHQYFDLEVRTENTGSEKNKNLFGVSGKEDKLVGPFMPTLHEAVMVWLGELRQ